MLSKVLRPGVLICATLAATASGQTPKAGELCEFYSPAENPPPQLKAMPRLPVFVTLPGDIDPHRSLFVHDRATLDAKDFTLTRTLTQLAAQISTLVPGTTATGIFRQF